MHLLYYYYNLQYYFFVRVDFRQEVTKLHLAFAHLFDSAFILPISILYLFHLLLFQFWLCFCYWWCCYYCSPSSVCFLPKYFCCFEFIKCWICTDFSSILFSSRTVFFFIVRFISICYFMNTFFAIHISMVSSCYSLSVMKHAIDLE